SRNHWGLRTHAGGEHHRPALGVVDGVHRLGGAELPRCIPGATRSEADATAGGGGGAVPRRARHHSGLDASAMARPSIVALLEAGPAEAPAIGAPGGVKSLLYRDLQALARRTVETLNSVGIGRGDRVAIVLHNGPEMASSFLCVAAGAATAPLN